VLIHGETKVTPTDPVLITPLKVIEATTEATEVKNFTPEIKFKKLIVHKVKF